MELPATAVVTYHVVPAMSQIDSEALRLGRFRRHPRKGTWSARFVLDAGPSGEAALDHVEDLAVAMGRAGGLEGGVTTGEPLLVRGAMKPISTLRNKLR